MDGVSDAGEDKIFRERRFLEQYGRFFWLLPLFFLVLILGVMYVLVNRVPTEKVIRRHVIIPTKAGQQSPTAIPTTGWKTFVHPQYGYSLLYPKDGEISGTDGIYIGKSKNGRTYIYIAVFEKGFEPITGTMRGWAENLYKEAAGERILSISVDNHEAVRVGPMHAGDGDVIYVKGGEQQMVQFNSFPDADPSTVEVFKKIVESFKFSQETASSSKSGVFLNKDGN